MANRIHVVWRIFYWMMNTCCLGNFLSGDRIHVVWGFVLLGDGIHDVCGFFFIRS